MEVIPLTQVGSRGVRRDLAPRRLVGRTPAACSSALVGVPRLRDVGGVPERALHVRPVPLAVLLAGDSGATRRTPGSARSRPGGRRCCRSRRRSSSCRSPACFRFTCYYYRGAYYKAFWADPPACAVGEPRKSYRGENSFPLILQNVHRYFLYVAVAVHRPAGVRRLAGAVVRRPGDGQTRVRHRRRHARSWRSTSSCSAATRSAATRCGTWSAAARTCVSKSPTCDKAATTASAALNRKHMLWAWCSLFSVGVRRRLRAAVLDGHLDRL